MEINNLLPVTGVPCHVCVAVMCDITTIISVWVVGRDKSSDVEDNGDVLLSGAAAITARRMLLTLPPAVYTDYTLGIHRSRGSIVLGFLTSCSWEGVAELRW